MKKLIILLLVIFAAQTVKAQDKYLSLTEALKAPSECTEIVFSPKDSPKKLSKFFRKSNEFENLYSVYIKKGVEKGTLTKLIEELNKLAIVEVLWECDSINNFNLLSKLYSLDHIALINVNRLSDKDKQKINMLNAKELSLRQSDTSINWEFIALPENLEALKVKSSQVEGYKNLTEIIKPLPRLSAVSLPLEVLSALAPELITVPALNKIELYKTTEVNISDDEVYEETLWLSVFKGSVSQIIELNFKSAEPITYQEKNKVLASFPNSSFISTQKAIGLVSQDQKATTTRSLNRMLFAKQSEVSPLVESADVNRSITSIYADEPNGITYSSGTVVHIPANAFVDEQGNVVEGKVDISYREMKTPTEILLAGIPMAYDSGGVINQFQSAGNFEILAAQNGKPLRLANGKNINIDFVMADGEAGYNFYKYNAQTNNWDYKNEANTPVDPKKVYEGERARWGNENFTADSLQVAFPFDCTPFDERFYSEHHIFLADSNKEAKWYNYKRGFEGFTINKGEARRPLISGTKIHSKKRLVKIKIKRVKNVKRDSLYQVRFSLSQRMLNKKDFMFFPELRAFRGRKFFTLEETRNRDFRNDFTRRKRYFDLRVEYTKGDDVCYIHLKDKDGIQTIEVDVTEGRTGRGKTLKKWSFNLRYKRYLKLLRKKEAIFDERLSQKRTRFIGMSSLRNRNPVTRSLSISGLGIYNCDQIRRLQTPIARINKLKILADSFEVTPNMVYVIDSKINGVLTYYGGLGVALNENNTKAIVAVDGNGNVFFTNTVNTNAILNKTFEMKRVPTEEIKTASQFNTILGL
jgi:hypothetical protein